MCFCQKNGGVILNDGTFDRRKPAYIFASLYQGEWFSYLFSVLRKISHKLGKKLKISNFLYLNSPKKPERKKLDIISV